MTNLISRKDAKAQRKDKRTSLVRELEINSHQGIPSFATFCCLLFKKSPLRLGVFA